jgi:TonB family protein
MAKLAESSHCFSSRAIDEKSRYRSKSLQIAEGANRRRKLALWPVLNSYANGCLSAKLFGGENANSRRRILSVRTCFATQVDSPIYQVGGDVKAPRPISTVIPPPPASVDKQLTVRLSFVVTADGSVANVRVLKRSKSEFDDFAVGVVSKWKFEPATKDGKPVAVRLETEVRSHR